MGGITQALAAAARSHGVRIRTGAPVSRVLTENGAACGVVLESGETIRSATVVSNADPKRSLLTLVPESELDPTFRKAVQGIDQRGSMARIHLLIDELPAYLGFDSAEGPQHHGHQLLGASVENYERAWESQRRGEFPEEYVIEAVIQSTHDPTLAPPGQHTLTLGVQQLPFELAQGSWNDARESWADAVVADLCRYAPNLRDHILARHVITPLDLELTYGLTGGNIFQGQMFLDQLFGSRPLPEIASYRTPIRSYYLCGVGMHPGGGVMGASGHNAAQVVLADRTGAPITDRAASGRTRSGGLIDRLMQTGPGRRAGYQLARQKAFRPLAKLAARSGTTRPTRDGDAR
jgi:phytoene dehydrogenase-like protein